MSERKTFCARLSEVGKEALEYIKEQVPTGNSIRFETDGYLEDHYDIDRDERWTDLPYVDHFGKYNTWTGYRIFKVEKDGKGELNFVGYTDDSESDSVIWNFDLSYIPTNALCEIADEIFFAKEKEAANPVIEEKKL